MTDLAIQPAVLSAAPPFSALPERERISLLTRLPRRIYPARAIIVRAGEPSCGLYALLSGSAKLVMDDPKGRQITLALLRAGDLFGEIDPFEPQAHIATVVATKPCEVVRMPIGELVACMTAHPRAALLVIAELARRLRITYGKVASLAFDDVHSRVARALLDCAKPDGIVWKVDVGSEDVARIVGASREMVSRVLKNLREAGLIGRCGRRIDILNHDGLHKECVRTSPRAAQEGPSSLSGRPAMTRVVLKARMRERGLDPDRMRGGGTGPRGPAAGPQSGKGGGPGPRARQPQG